MTTKREIYAVISHDFSKDRRHQQKHRLSPSNIFCWMSANSNEQADNDAHGTSMLKVSCMRIISRICIKCLSNYSIDCWKSSDLVCHATLHVLDNNHAPAPNRQCPYFRSTALPYLVGGKYHDVRVLIAWCSLSSFYCLRDTILEMHAAVKFPQNNKERHLIN